MQTGTLSPCDSVGIEILLVLMYCVTLAFTTIVFRGTWTFVLGKIFRIIKNTFLSGSMSDISEKK